VNEVASAVAIAGVEMLVWEAIGLVSVAVVWGDLAVVSATVEGTHTHGNGHGSPGRGGNRRQMGWQWVASAINSRRRCFVGAAKATDFCGHDMLRSERGGLFRQLFMSCFEV